MAGALAGSLRIPKDLARDPAARILTKDPIRILVRMSSGSLRIPKDLARDPAARILTKDPIRILVRMPSGSLRIPKDLARDPAIRILAKDPIRILEDFARILKQAVEDPCKNFHQGTRLLGRY